MKLLLYSINFTPELTGIGKYTGEMTAWLAQHGHDVRVITAPPYYPAWQVSEGYSACCYKQQDWQGTRVYRTPLWVPTQPGGLKRLLHLASFALSSLPVLLAQWRWKPDIVFVVEPPLMCAPAASLFACLRGARSWLHVQDYEVDAAFDLGLVKGRVLRRWITAAEAWLMRRFDRVSTISGRMIERALAKGVDPARLLAFPNWVDISSIHPDMAGGVYRAELGIAPDQVVALYSGNMGNKQGLEVLADMARQCEDDPRLVFVFCGNGSGRADLQTRCTGLRNVQFLDLQPHERLGQLLTMADVHLLPQRADAADLVMPSKLTGMLASGRPVVATANPGTEVAQVVAGCGLVVKPEDATALANAVKSLAEDVALRESLGRTARRYAEDHLHIDAVLAEFEAQCLKLIGFGNNDQCQSA